MQNKLLQITDLENTYRWDQILGHDKLKQWAEELGNAFEKKASLDQWNLIGKATILINSDPQEYAAQIAKTIAKNSRMNLIIFDKEEILNSPTIAELKKYAPLIVFIKHGRWCQEKPLFSEETEEETKKFSEFKINLKEWLKTFSPNAPVIFLTAGNGLEMFSTDLQVRGLFDLFLSLPSKSYELVGQEFIHDLGKEICGSSLTSSFGKIGHLVRYSDSVKRDLTVLALRRKSYYEKRQIEYLDLVDVQIHQLIEEGLVQEKNDKTKLQTAYHEAGHALMGIFEYDGKNVAEYTSILPGTTFAGITFLSEGYEFKFETNQFTYLDFRQRVRVFLGGRAAEELLVGSIGVSSGASSDLAFVTDMARHHFSFSGLAPHMENFESSKSNLAVILGEPTVLEAEYIKNLTRDFLSVQYDYVFNLLKKNIQVLDDLASRLMIDPIVDQDELAEICLKHKIVVIKH